MEKPIRIEYAEPQIVQGPERKIVGVSQKMSLATHDVARLWGVFMPRRKEIQNTISKELLSLAIYSEDHFISFDPNRVFEKWAGVEVSAFPKRPSSMEAVVIPSGLYAVFHYKGRSTDQTIYRYIFQQWLPKSGYELDNRPHFEILGEKYRNNDPESEEEIWIPIRKAGL